MVTEWVDRVISSNIPDAEPKGLKWLLRDIGVA